MSTSIRTATLAMSSLVAIGAVALGGNAFAADKSTEQCAGVIKAGKNDCATRMNACHGHSAVDNSPEAWIYLPKGACERIVGAHLVEVKDPTPANKSE